MDNPWQEKHNRKFTVGYGNGHGYPQRVGFSGDDGHGQKGEHILGKYDMSLLTPG